MRLTDAQRTFIRERNKANRRALAANPRNGYFTFIMENQLMSLLLEIDKLGAQPIE